MKFHAIAGNGIMRIRLTQGKFTIVGPRDYAFLNQWKWHYYSGGYAVRTINDRKTLMHRVILERMGYKNFTRSDHINRNKFDNRRCNLLPATNSQNGCNRNRQKNNTSGYTGVCWDRGKWRADIGINGKQIFLGLYDDSKEAARVRDKVALEYHDQFAELNGV